MAGVGSLLVMHSAQHSTCDVPVPCDETSRHPSLSILVQHSEKFSTTFVGEGTEEALQSKFASAAHIASQLSGVPIVAPEDLSAGVPRLLASSQSFVRLGVLALHDPSTIPVSGLPAQSRKYPTLLVVGSGFGIPASGPAHAAQQSSGVANLFVSISLQTAKQQPCMFCIVALYSA